MSDIQNFESTFNEFWYEDGRPPSSFREILTFYGLLDVSLNGGLENRIELYETPEKLSGLDDLQVITHIFQLDEEAETLEYEDSTVRSKPDSDELLYANYSAGRGYDYSIAHLVKTADEEASVEVDESGDEWSFEGSLDDFEATGRMFTEWPFEGDSDKIDEFVDEYEFGWILRELQPAAQRASGKIHKNLRNITYSGDAVLGRVAFRDSEGNLKPVNGFDVFVEATKERETVVSSEKGDYSGSGVTKTSALETEESIPFAPDDPMGYQSSNHPDETFMFDYGNDWRRFPLSSSESMLMKRGATFLDSLSVSVGGIRLHLLPYPSTTLTPELCLGVAEALSDSNEGEFNFLDIESINPTDINYYMFVQEHSSSGIRVYNEISGISNSLIYDLGSNIHKSREHLIDNSLLTIPDISGVSNDTAERLSGHIEKTSEKEEAIRLLVGEYSKDIFVSDYSDTGEKLYSKRRKIEFVSTLLQGKQYDTRELLKNMVQRQEEYDLSDFRLITALTHEIIYSAVSQETEKSNNSSELNSNKSTMASNKFSQAETEIVENLIESSHTPTTESKGAMLFGILVGAVSEYQENGAPNINSTVDSNIRTSNLTVNDIQRRYPEVIEKCRIYGKQSDFASEMMVFSGTVNLFNQIISERPIEEWDIDSETVRFNYSVGLSYGYNLRSSIFDQLDD